MDNKTADEVERLLKKSGLTYNQLSRINVGINCDAIHILTDARDDVLFLCKRTYDYIPDIKINCLEEALICYIPSHLYFVLFEIIKNSVRACCENGKGNIDIVISGIDDVVIKISDKGNDIPYNEQEKIWYYSYTTVKDNFYNTENFNNKRSPLAGYGIGLPLSRSIVRFLDGEIKLMSMEGYGTDVYITLPKEK